MSIKRQISLLFLLSLTIMIGLSLWIERLNHQKNEQIVITHYLTLAKELLPAIVDNDLALLRRKVTTLKLERVSVVAEGELLLRRPITFGEIRLFYYADNSYRLGIQYLDEMYAFEDKTIELFDQEQFITNLLLLFDIVILLVIYFVIMKIIEPIRKLSRSMQRFSKGEFDLRVPLGGATELQELSSSFNQMASKLNLALEERENLLKYIGHELKTPLAKSKFALEMNQPKILAKSLEDMENLVSEILEMHLLNRDRLNLRHFKVQTLITEALNRLYIEEESCLEIELDDFDMVGDLGYLAVAVKNLVENALKYSTQRPIAVVVVPHKIEVSSEGVALSQELEFYLKPFTQEDPTASGYGLGLHIVQRVMLVHDFELFYEHKEGKNVFTLLLKRSC